jgi:translation initiation factor IF-1
MGGLDTLECMGTVMKVLGNNNYSVEIGETEEQKREILCHLGGKMRRFRINIIPGDEVSLEVPAPYDKGRITFRGKKEDRIVNTGGQKRTKNKKKPKGKGGRR